MKVILLRGLALLVGLGVGVGAAMWLVLWVSLVSSAVEVPELRGHETARAVAALQQGGLVGRIQEGVFDPQVGAGRVAVQRPAAGYELKRGGTVLLYPSLGEATVRLPDLTGLPASVAEVEVEGHELIIERRSEVSGQADAVVVIAQSPPAEALLGSGAGVALLINRAPRERRYVMPDLVGRSEVQATATIRRLGFRLATVQSVVYPGIHTGVVLRQDPPAGGPVSETAVTALWVSR